MADELTWYEILDVLPGCSADEVQQAFEAKESILGSRRISGAPSKVVTAAGRARTAIETARDVLTDPARRQRYDYEIGLRPTGGGLSRPEPVPSEGGWASDTGWYNRSAMIGGEALEAIGVGRTVPEPDVLVVSREVVRSDSLVFQPSDVHLAIEVVSPGR